MSLIEKLTSIKTKLTSVLSDINTALVAKGATEVTSLAEVPTAIESVQSGGNGETVIDKKVPGPIDFSQVMPNYTNYSLLVYWNDMCSYAMSPETNEWFFKLILTQTDVSKSENLSYAFADSYVCIYDGFPDMEVEIEDFNAVMAVNCVCCFWGCKPLTRITNVNNINATNTECMFADCYKLHTITNLNAISPTTILNCPNLVNVSLLENTKINLDLGDSYSYFDISDSPLLTLDSLVGFLNAFTTSTSATAYFGSTNIAKLSPEHLAIALEKNITLY